MFFKDLIIVKIYPKQNMLGQDLTAEQIMNRFKSHFLYDPSKNYVLKGHKRSKEYFSVCELLEHIKPQLVICNQCNKPKRGSITGICEHCDKFGYSSTL